VLTLQLFELVETRFDDFGAQRQTLVCLELGLLGGGGKKASSVCWIALRVADTFF